MFIEILDFDIADLSNTIFTYTKVQVMQENKIKNKVNNTSNSIIESKPNIEYIEYADYMIELEIKQKEKILPKINICNTQEPIISHKITSKKSESKHRVKPKKEYESKVRKLTKLQDLNSLPNSDKPKAIFGNFQSKEHYVIDHKISIWFGFKNNIPTHVIADLSNLRWITAFDNSKKTLNNFIDKDNQWIIDNHLLL